jgi:hypothetical protein
MAATIGLVEAAAALRDHFGSRLDAGREEGHDLIVDALRKQFSISGRAARNLVKDLEQARTIRWRPGTRSTMDGTPGGSAAGMGSGVSSPGMTGIGQHLIQMYEGSYWQLAPSD